MSDPDALQPKNVDIGALLGVAFGEPPRDDFADKVGAKVTLMTTVTELALLVCAAPLDWLRHDPEGTQDDPA